MLGLKKYMFYCMINTKEDEKDKNKRINLPNLSKKRKIRKNNTQDEESGI